MVSSSATSASSDLTRCNDMGRQSNMELVYFGPQKFCDCRKFCKASKWTSWTRMNLGRRLYGCPNYMVKSFSCEKTSHYTNNTATSTLTYIKKSKKEVFLTHLPPKLAVVASFLSGPTHGATDRCVGVPTKVVVEAWDPKF
ncbi:conserved hypothetical protein [Ricinus communis]|uniref:Zinc finger GRF-type domain-containing protein n=1 Tax=Ricinus communis TaxID=3988 RepID=B9SL33_RICCO|nr:conserved hypothetical protein [Ricinus communis]